ncbi:MAG: methylmalonyl-CoA mutase [Flavobacteriales bacterium]|nr:MAG: methylmalonyl-CoA mutase [Flavobacteriales bacterium]
MKTKLFQDFDPVSSKQWKQQIQFELKGADYNDNLIWESLEGIKVKPFYHSDDNISAYTSNTNTTTFTILQQIFVHDIQMSNKKGKESLQRGAESIHFTIESDKIDIAKLMTNLPLGNVIYYINLLFLSPEYVKILNDFAATNSYNFIIQVDPVGQLCKDGNWFENLNSDFQKLNEISKNSSLPFLKIQSGIYQNSGANMVQQLAYTLAHINEYFNRISTINQPITIEVAIGTNYFFEIAKIRALRLLFKTLAKEYNHDFDCHIIAIPTKRNKTIYDYNVNMLRTTTECMSAILGGANAISNLAYDAIYHKDNEFGDRISRNQLLILKEESYFDKVNNPSDGAYYIESLTEQLAEKALELFKEIEANGGFITQLIEGTIQRKISESAQKEQELFNSGKEILLGTNKYPNPNDKMKYDLELFPFVKTKDRKTLIIPIIEKRLAEKVEQERLALEE